MTKVDFYILPDDSIEQRYRFACRLAEKAFKLGHSIYIHNDDGNQASVVDQLLWSWRNSSFIPHQLEHFKADVDDTLGNIEQIQVGFSNGGGSVATLNGLMINLSHSVPEFFSRFERVSEIVVQTPAVTESSRNNYRFYRDRGYQLDNHDLRP
jgi:DNA polymerase-3 subunit chi